MSPTCTSSVFPSRSHAYGVCIKENAFISPGGSWSGLGTLLQYQHVSLSRRGECFAHRGVSVVCKVCCGGGGKGNVPEVHGAEKDGVTEPEQLSSKMQQAPFPFVI